MKIQTNSVQRKLFIQLWSEKSKWTFVSKVGWQLILSSQKQFHVASKPRASSIYHFFVVVCSEKHLRLTAFKTSRMKIISPLLILICGVGKKNSLKQTNSLCTHLGCRQGSCQLLRLIVSDRRILQAAFGE